MTIGELIDDGRALIQTGPFGSQLHAHDYVSTGIPVIPTEAIGRRLINDAKLPKVSSETARRLQRHRLRCGDILFARRGIQATGLSAIVYERHEGALCGTGAILLRIIDPKIDPTYVSFALALDSTCDWIRSRAVGAVMPNLNASILRALPLQLPEPSIQRSISSVLSSLDDKIALNRRMNHTLEATAAALFRSWFVDFDPVVAKAEGRRAVGVPVDVRDVFPATFSVDGELAVPAGWCMQAVSEFIELNPTRRLPNGTVAPYLDMAATPTTGHAPDKWIHRAAGSGARFVNGDTLLARITPCLENGKSAFVDSLADGEVGWGSTEFIVLRPIEPIPPVFAYLLARWPDFRDHAERSMTGSSGRQRVALDALAAFKFVRPPDSVARAFGESVKPLFERVASNMAENRTLAALRDTLLPQLLSGAIRLRDAERAVGTAI
ncbi:restriction endonuclease subunit S [Gemmatimonas sp.]